jgi:hypothetical protein
MNREDITQMAWEARLWIDEKYNPIAEALERFAALVAAHEREACAKVCDEIQERCSKRNMGRWPEDCPDDEDGAEDCATAIRARE